MVMMMTNNFCTYCFMKTCKHYRNQIPKEDADELRLADSEPCEVCDTCDRYLYCEHRRMKIFIPKFQVAVADIAQS